MVCGCVCARTPVKLRIVTFALDSERHPRLYIAVHIGVGRIAPHSLIQFVCVCVFPCCLYACWLDELRQDKGNTGKPGPMRISQGQRKARPRTRAGQDQQSDKAAWPTQANTGRPGPTQAGQGLHWQAAVNMGRPMATQAGQGQHKQARASTSIPGPAPEPTPSDLRLQLAAAGRQQIVYRGVGAFRAEAAYRTPRKLRVSIRVSKLVHFWPKLLPTCSPVRVSTQMAPCVSSCWRSVALLQDLIREPRSEIIGWLHQAIGCVMALASELATCIRKVYRNKIPWKQVRGVARACSGGGGLS